MPHQTGFPAKAGTHSSTGSGAEEWIPAFAGKRLIGRNSEFASDVQQLTWSWWYREIYSASGCFEGWASAKAGSAMQLSYTRMTRLYGARSHSNPLAGVTCVTSAISAIVG